MQSSLVNLLSSKVCDILCEGPIGSDRACRLDPNACTVSKQVSTSHGHCIVLLCRPEQPMLSCEEENSVTFDFYTMTMGLHSGCDACKVSTLTAWLCNSARYIKQTSKQH